MRTAATPATGVLDRLVLDSVARTHTGLVRRRNEDRVLERPDSGLWAVADGMGGHAGGEDASALIVATLAALGPFASAYAFLNGVCDALQAVNRRLIDQAAASPAGGPMGSTVVALLVHDAHFACVWAGDSRAYRLRDGALERLTRDHSVVQALVDAGSLTPAEARRHPQAHVLTRAVGDADPLALDVCNGDLRPGDRFLLCSDGLSGLVTDAEIEAGLATPGLAAAADDLLALALRRGGRDNVSLVAVAAA